MKEAVVLILDANDSMNKAVVNDAGDDGGPITTSSRFECAKQVAQDMISDLMIRSKTNEVAVVVLKTNETRHHFYEATTSDDQEEEEGSTENTIPFPNITELGGTGDESDVGVNRPTPELLRQVQKLQATQNSQRLRGDFCDGIIVGADALYRRTVGKKYQRRIVLITDAEHKVLVDHSQLLVVLDSLRAMECRLEVIGLEFEQQAAFDHAASADTATAKKVKQGEGEETVGEDTANKDDDDDSATDVSEDEDGDQSDDNEDEDDDEEGRLLIKRQNERLLIGLTEKTGGFVLAAKEIHSILQKVLGQRIPKSTRRKFLFQIAPGLVLDARFSLLLSKASTPSLKKQVAMVDGANNGDGGEVQTNAFGDEMTSDYQTIVSHWEPEHEEQEVMEIAQAYRYGSDLVPMGGLDLSGLTNVSPVKLTILGYLPKEQVPPELQIGPPYAVSGADSRRACAAISALARALARKHQVGIATMVKSKDADPILVGLLPLESGDNPIHLVFTQLPFRGDVPRLSLPAFDASSRKSTKIKRQTACDDIIDALHLPHDAVDYTQIPNPYIRSFHQTVVQRVLDPNSPVVCVRDRDDPMSTPKEVVERARFALHDFRKAFSLTKVYNQGTTTATTKRRKGPATYRDFVQDDEEESG